MRITKQRQIDQLQAEVKRQKEIIGGLEIELRATNAAIDRLQGTAKYADLKRRVTITLPQLTEPELDCLRTQRPGDVNTVSGRVLGTFRPLADHLL